ncbi:MAG: hypothetical protein R3F59_31315 [Myxococcota bacterium]
MRWTLWVGCCAVGCAHRVPEVASPEPAPVAAPAPAPAPTSGACDEATGEGAAWRDAVVAESGFYGFAAGLWGEPTSCHLAWSEGEARLGFAWGEASLTVEHLPPETSVTLLRAPGGFPDAEAARAVLRAEAERVGLPVEWAQAEVQAGDGEQAQVYWATEEGTNLSYREVLQGDVLVGIGESIAL